MLFSLVAPSLCSLLVLVLVLSFLCSHHNGIESCRKSVCRMYAEVSKSVAEPKVSANHAPPKLKGIFRAERHDIERESWRQEAEVSDPYITV